VCSNWQHGTGAHSSRDYMFQLFNVQQSLGFTLIYGFSDCFTGAVLFIKKFRGKKLTKALEENSRKNPTI
jgi:hypothetical protein